ncbi:MAG: tRNA (adenosine(37)-N6)-threonylcarbamoyltransferase complex ATPase subunit type 1 TsaE [bacterium]|nr:tRNA (adenosine(37)-N6)-threonylcarbamoyltransferase complex ATPase subunit type 1 TsaE [bacterium]
MEISLSALPHFAEDFIARLPKAARTRAYVVGLQGELGAGKTTFVQAVAKAFGVSEPVASPTFVIAQAYPIDREPFSRLVHVDAYRLSPEEKDTVGWRGYADEPENLILVEWPERLPSGMSPLGTLLTFAVSGENTREISEHHAGS